MKKKIEDLIKSGKSDEDIKKIMADEESVERMEEIRDEMMGLLEEARELVQGTEAEDQFESYTAPHIIMALTKDHEFVGSNYNFDDAIEDMQEVEQEEIDKDAEEVEEVEEEVEK